MGTQNPSEWNAIDIASTIKDPIKEERECAQQNPKTSYAEILLKRSKNLAKRKENLHSNILRLPTLVVLLKI